MKTLHYSFLLIAALYTACGQQEGAKGFVSDAAICQPIFETGDPTLDPAKGKAILPAPASSTLSIGQLSTVATEKKFVWGYELYLSNGVEGEAKFTVEPLIKKAEGSSLEIQTLGPDGTIAFKTVVPNSESMSSSLTPNWIRGQFDSAISIGQGDAVWLVVKPSFTGSQSLIGWYQTGSGLWVTVAGSPAYVKVPNMQIAHRLVYCK